jgi:3-oxo-4,17-pregnadiene-20-carboxyl-CoA hydratase alpha subunit
VSELSKEETDKKAASSDEAPAAAQRMRPVIGHDNGWWWDRVNEGELPIQRCKECGTLRHPPRPMCWKCQSLERDHIVSSGKGTVYSYVVVHRPPFPGYEYPLAVAVVELEEGTRIVSNLVGIEPERVEIGMPVKLSIEAVDEELKLPLFRPAS